MMADEDSPIKDHPDVTDSSLHDDGNHKTEASKPPLSRWRKHSRIIVIASIFTLIVAICVPLLAVYVRHRPVGATVDLGYAQYRGTAQKGSDVRSWLGIRYAAPPVGDLRFAAPQDPVTTTGVQDATKHGNTCLSVNERFPFDRNTDEDCLFLDVYTPSKATSESKLPVFFFIQGGGFAGNANANYNGRGLIRAAGLDMVVVTFNYRVGPFGFMAGSVIESLNNGLKDQRKALEWVQQHISKFGGNPGHIVLGGDSAGAMSVALHMSAYGGNDTNLFHAAAMESPSFATVLNNNQSQFLFDAFVNNTNCTAASDKLACLKSLSPTDIQKANTRYPYPGATGPPVFSWNPVLDGDFIRDLTYNSFSHGKFVKVPTIVGDDTNAGTIFAPRDIDSLNRSNTFLQNTFPYLNATHIAKLNQLYPNDNQTSYPNAGSYWRRTANVYGEMRYMCANMYLASAINTHGKSKGVSVWNYRYNVQDPAQISNGFGVPHTAELPAIWGADNLDGNPIPTSYQPGKPNADIIPTMQGYWTSFIRSLDPNSHRKDATPEWQPWSTILQVTPQSFSVDENESSTKERLLFDTPVNATAMETVDDGLWQRCEYLWSIGVDLHQ